jgi:hypothetical protein
MWAELNLTFEYIDEGDLERISDAIENALCPNPGHGHDEACGRAWTFGGRTGISDEEFNGEDK